MAASVSGQGWRGRGRRVWRGPGRGGCGPEGRPRTGRRGTGRDAGRGRPGGPASTSSRPPGTWWSSGRPRRRPGRRRPERRRGGRRPAGTAMVTGPRPALASANRARASARSWPHAGQAGSAPAARPGVARGQRRRRRAGQGGGELVAVDGQGDSPAGRSHCLLRLRVEGDVPGGEGRALEEAGAECDSRRRTGRGRGAGGDELVAGDGGGRPGRSGGPARRSARRGPAGR